MARGDKLTESNDLKEKFPFTSFTAYSESGGGGSSGNDDDEDS